MQSISCPCSSLSYLFEWFGDENQTKIRHLPSTGTIARRGIPRNPINAVTELDTVDGDSMWSECCLANFEAWHLNVLLGLVLTVNVRYVRMVAVVYVMRHSVFSIAKQPFYVIFLFFLFHFRIDHNLLHFPARPFESCILQILEATVAFRFTKVRFFLQVVIITTRHLLRLSFKTRFQDRFWRMSTRASSTIN